MKILNISLDKNILNKDSAVAKRIIEYGDLVEKYTVIVSSGEKEKIIISDKAQVFSFGGNNKIVKLLNCYFLAKRILKENFDLITIQDQYYFGLLGLKLARKFKIGLEIQVHGFEKYKGLRKIIAKKVIKNADAIRVVSNRLKKELVCNFGVAEKKITVVPIYSELRITNYELGKKKSDDKFIFLTVGRLVPVKNIKMQIKALFEVIKKHKNIELLIIGDGEGRESLKNLCYELRVMSYVKFLGWQSDLDEIYKKADSFLLTSNYEGWGMVIVEAASFGLPIIMTDVGCAGELIKDGESGLVIPVGDQKALAEAMARLIENENLRKSLGQGAREAIKNLPTKEETFQKYLESWNKAKLK